MPSAPTPTAPDRDRERGGTALVILDMLNRFDFAGGESLKPRAQIAARSVGRLRDAMDGIGAPTIYVNDNFGQWHSEKSRLIEQARECAPALVGLIEPRDTDYFVIKPQFSAFYSTNLPLLLPKLGVSRLVLTGIAADICVLFTAADAHMRDYALWVPEDAVAAETDEGERLARTILQQSLGSEVASSHDLALDEWLASLDERGIR